MSFPNIDKEVLSKLQSYLSLLKFKWDNIHPNKESYFSLGKTRVLDCTVFLISTLDSLILFVQDNIPKGSDKKLAVMAVVSEIFDHIMIKSAPLWLKPFVPLIKEVVVSIVVSQLIEFIVVKYKEGMWNSEGKIASENKIFVPNLPDSPQESIIYKSRKEIK